MILLVTVETHAYDFSKHITRTRLSVPPLLTMSSDKIHRRSMNMGVVTLKCISSIFRCNKMDHLLFMTNEMTCFIQCIIFISFFAYYLDTKTFLLSIFQQFSLCLLSFKLFWFVLGIQFHHIFAGIYIVVKHIPTTK